MTRMPPPPVTRCHVLHRLMASSSRKIYRNGVIVMSSMLMKTKCSNEGEEIGCSTRSGWQTLKSLRMIHLHMCEANNNRSITLLESISTNACTLVDVFKDVKKHHQLPSLGRS
ncbi:hypothetical protein Ddye_025217 [Dipteronia dyeriana]|uniref:Uncharacterized protein n=1 Tax=Dipteronia dyeriana TaxID=168575 RepID=A0AAD9WTP8_9ROSI|nr:hypothetical protein Ddye_025217 [Dipteronia dyeriana]